MSSEQNTFTIDTYLFSRVPRIKQNNEVFLPFMENFLEDTVFISDNPVRIANSMKCTQAILGKWCVVLRLDDN